MTVKELIAELVQLVELDSINEEKEIYFRYYHSGLCRDENECITSAQLRDDYVFLSPYDIDGFRKEGKIAEIKKYER